MLEAVVLAVLALLTAFVPLWVLLVSLLLALPGLWAMYTGAPFLPTPRRIVDAMLPLAAIQPGERVYDLGCGDGRLVFAAAACGADAVGYEFSLLSYLLAKARSLFHRRAHIAFRNFWKQDYRDAAVVFCFLTMDTMKRFEREIWPPLKPGCRVVSHAFKMPSIPVTREMGGAVLYVK